MTDVIEQVILTDDEGTVVSKAKILASFQVIITAQPVMQGPSSNRQINQEVVYA